MILGRFEHRSSACFDEIDFAVRQMTDRVVCFNAHLYEAPPGSIIFSMEDVRVPTNDGSFVMKDPEGEWAGHEVWNPFPSHIGRYPSTYVPIGYHPSMERFKRAVKQDIDVLFVGVMNPRRQVIVDGLRARGLTVHYEPRLYGQRRDSLLARTKLSLQMQYNPHGEWNHLRVAHCVANRVPILSETHPSGWSFVRSCSYEKLIDQAEALVRAPDSERADMADEAYQCFVRMPMVLPEPRYKVIATGYGRVRASL